MEAGLKIHFLNFPVKEISKGDVKMGNGYLNSQKLSHALLDSGFFPAFGTREKKGTNPTSYPVKWGTPFFWDYDDGVVVVYDEIGRPWIIQGHDLSEKAEKDLIGEFSLRRGASVPHSKDGGKFVNDTVSPYFKEFKKAMAAV